VNIILIFCVNFLQSASSLLQQGLSSLSFQRTSTFINFMKSTALPISATAPLFYILGIHCCPNTRQHLSSTRTYFKVQLYSVEGLTILTPMCATMHYCNYLDISTCNKLKELGLLVSDENFWDVHPQSSTQKYIHTCTHMRAHTHTHTHTHLIDPMPVLWSDMKHVKRNMIDHICTKDNSRV
jgi:hypothetical protein